MTVNSGTTVLIVEDEAINRLFLVRACERLGYATLQAQTGKDAVEQYRNFAANIGIVFMDLTMPVMDGIEASKQLRAMGASIPIVALTAHSSDEDRRICLNTGMNEVLTKPVQIQQIQAVLERYMEST